MSQEYAVDVATFDNDKVVRVERRFTEADCLEDALRVFEDGSYDVIESFESLEDYLISYGPEPDGIGWLYQGHVRVRVIAPTVTGDRVTV